MMTEKDPPRHPVDPAQSAPAPFSVRVGTAMQSIDLIEARIRRHDRMYLDHTFTPLEIEAYGGYTAEPHLLAPGLAACFCAKEAAVKVLRPTAIIPEWDDIEVLPMPGGWHRLTVSGAARQIADERGLTDLQVSISEDGDIAVATVIGIEGPPTEAD